jgi:hypothetical protein
MTGGGSLMKHIPLYDVRRICDLKDMLRYCNHKRGHSSLDDRTPDEVYYELPHPFAEAAS